MGVHLPYRFRHFAPIGAVVPTGRACKTLDDEDDAGWPAEGRRLGDAGEPMGLLEAATRLGVRNIQTGRCTTRNLNGLRRRPRAVQKCSSWTAMASVDQTFRVTGRGIDGAVVALLPANAQVFGPQPDWSAQCWDPSWEQHDGTSPTSAAGP
jgi:hypothetical protein